MWSARRPRRAVLTGLAGLVATAVVAGCDPFGSAPPPGPHALDPMVAATRALLARYDAAIAAFAELAAKVGFVRDDHKAHLAALVAATGKPAPTNPVPAPTTTSAPPADPTATVAALAAAEQTAAEEATAACLAAQPAYAALLGSIAACRTTHLEVLK